jgi:hypothetical protein
MFNAGKPFVDDLKVEVEDSGVVQIKSQSRVGDSDFGVNAKVRKMMNHCHVFHGIFALIDSLVLHFSASTTLRRLLRRRVGLFRRNSASRPAKAKTVESKTFFCYSAIVGCPSYA